MPVVPKGSSTQLIMYRQTDLQTAATGVINGLVIPYIDTDLRVTADTVESRVLTGYRNPAEPAPNERGVDGGFTFQPDVRSIGWILRELLGTLVTTGAGPTYTHTFTVGDLPVGGLTIEKWMPAIPACLRSWGIKLGSLSFDVTPGGLLEATVSVMGIDEIGDGGATAIPTSRLDSTPLTYAVQGFRLPSVTLSEGGSGLTTATRFSIEINNGLEGLRTIGNLGRYADISEGLFRASGTLSVLFSSLTIYNKAKAGTTSALSITFPSPANAAHSMTISFPEVQYSLASPGVPGPGGIVADLNWQAFSSTPSTQSACTVVLVNDVVSYPAAIP